MILRTFAIAGVTLLAAPLAGAQDTQQNDGQERDDRQRDRKIVTVAFGAGLNTAQPGNAQNHHVLPGVIRVNAGDVVNFVVSGQLKEILWRRFLSLKCDAEVARQLLADHDFFALSETEKFELVQRHQKKWSREVLPQVGLRTSFHLMSTAYRALQTYVPSPCPGPLYAICSDRYWGSTSPEWQEDPPGTTRLVRVQGDHLTAILHFAIPTIVEIIFGTTPH